MKTQSKLHRRLANERTILMDDHVKKLWIFEFLCYEDTMQAPQRTCQ